MHDAAVAVSSSCWCCQARELAGASSAGRDGGPVLWHGAQLGVVALQSATAGANDRGCATRAGREKVPVPPTRGCAMDAGIGTRVRAHHCGRCVHERYAACCPKRPAPVGVSRAASHGTHRGQRAPVGRAHERSLAGLAVLVIYIDGIRRETATHHRRLGVDEAGDKQCWA